MPGRRGARAGRGWDAIPPRLAGQARAGEDGLRDGRTGAAEAGRRGGPALPAEDGLRDGRTGAAEAGRRGGPALPAEDELRSGRTGAAGESRGGRGLPAEERRGGGRARAADEGTPAERNKAQDERGESERAREICLRQLAVRPRTRAELAAALARRQISAEVIAEVLDRYDEVGIVDDAAFARAWVSSRHHGRGLARRALANELRQRGVDAAVAGEALETLDDDEEAATARALVDRKLRTTRGEPAAVFRRLVSMLARKGYPAGVAIRAVKEALAARDAEAAEFAEQIDPDAMADQAEPGS